MIIAAFILGFAGSVHCVAMCGAIAAMLGGSLRNRIAYNAGRIFTYTGIGLLIGLVGETVRMTGIQQIVSIGIGILGLGMVLVPLVSKKHGQVYAFHAAVAIKFGALLHSRTSMQTVVRFVVAGVLNGLLPCGLVYSALGFALLQPSIGDTMFSMALFGMGTVPVMLFAGGRIPSVPTSIRRHSGKILPAIRIAVSLLFILRGLSLDIPYISPTVPQSVEVLATIKNDGHCARR
ncbi:MAG: sulfite exporter TauE/SafE family protein [Candidatus Kapabacteria bacterium]|nr:sulfite exporter TauE/SafE family protein [Candidatus Kapabacteria bacterium]